ncbi:MAG: hypothetical protein EHM61_25455 [Acidobacteria bacterium]|nr:MAG: hypothetical protein EHM61_25455 [Acidobacteriota bacterium]
MFTPSEKPTQTSSAVPVVGVRMLGAGEVGFGAPLSQPLLSFQKPPAKVRVLAHPLFQVANRL